MEGSKGFTLVELMIVIVIVAALAAVAIPNSVAMQDRAKEGAIRANMHQFQLAAEDYGVQYGHYAFNAFAVHDLLPAGGKNFANPFTKSALLNNAWEDRASPLDCPSAWVPGIVSYADTLQLGYNIKSIGSDVQPFSLVLCGGIVRCDESSPSCR